MHSHDCHHYGCRKKFPVVLEKKVYTAGNKHKIPYTIVAKYSYIVLKGAYLLVPHSIESYALATYPNSTSIAGLCFVAAMVFVAFRYRIPALILLVVAPMFRLDVVMIYPIPYTIVAKYSYIVLKGAYLLVPHSIFRQRVRPRGT